MSKKNIHVHSVVSLVSGQVRVKPVCVVPVGAKPPASPEAAHVLFFTKLMWTVYSCVVVVKTCLPIHAKLPGSSPLWSARLFARVQVVEMTHTRPMTALV